MKVEENKKLNEAFEAEKEFLKQLDENKKKDNLNNESDSENNGSIIYRVDGENPSTLF